MLQSVLKNYPEVAQYVVGQTQLTVIDESGIPKDSGKETVLRGSVRNGAIIGAGAKVIDSVLMPDAVVEEGAVVTRALVANGVTVGKGAVVGSADSEHIELVAKKVKGVE